ncbi:PHD finger protein ALFIN-LIKE 5-like [Prosopis cineraria]|uniref:PHD finger protein ALFIN-LIKE 5-like n=1 Tax=Prosopis cineraria TaxID=364024 RepID=UPI00240F9276|nr:PHD finger protein ALFIN-LIKE 5-like [Prosopis cineraria]XP_054817361.1 PHD finger protein ALFIN-LIKE 5-like [Prosopis cineraria]
MPSPRMPINWIISVIPPRQKERKNHQLLVQAEPSLYNRDLTSEDLKISQSTHSKAMESEASLEDRDEEENEDKLCKTCGQKGGSWVYCFRCNLRFHKCDNIKKKHCKHMGHICPLPYAIQSWLVI